MVAGLTTFIMIYAVGNGVVVAGLLVTTAWRRE